MTDCQDISGLPADPAGEILRAALAQGWIREEDSVVMVHDLGGLAGRIRRLMDAFPPDTLHALAVKANPLRRILEFARSAGSSVGAEAASAGEVALAQKAGFPGSRIVFDSPVKTPADLRFALEAGVHLNLDNLDELERVATLSGWGTLSGSLGLRINPQVGVGTIETSSVAGTWSKFGVPIRHRRQELQKAFLSCPWLTGVHLHVGSQGCPMEMLVDGVGILYDFTLEINDMRSRAGLPPVSVFDLGGGLPVSYRAGVAPPSLEAYAAALSRRAPALFDPAAFRLITEFGRWVFTNSGWTVSRVEYVKHDPPVNTVMIHAGADLFLRECLLPNNWSHEYTLYDWEGKLKQGTDDLPYHLAGPLCFSGDILARNVPLPPAEPGDYLVIHDTGGYTFSMWSRYNSRQTPRILGWNKGTFTILKERETLEELTTFWE